MSTGVIVAIVVAVVVVAAIVAAVTRQRGNGGAGLKKRFGPEYDRTLARHDGDEKAARAELTERVDRYGDIEPRPLSEAAQERYVARWTAVQARFVDEPGPALTEADRLIGELAAERGFPGADSPEHVDALSVHHPHHVQGYRQAHAFAQAHPDSDGRQATEDLRQALVSARDLFQGLLQSGRTDGTAAQSTPTVGRFEKPAQQVQSAPADDEQLSGRDRAAESDEAAEADTRHDADRDADQDRPRQRGHRFAALTGRSRPDDEV